MGDIKTSGKLSPEGNLSRRQFLSRCSVCTAGVLGLSVLRVSSSGGFFTSAETSDVKARVRIIFAYPNPKKPNWPNIGYDFEGRIQEIKKLLGQKFPNVEFLPVAFMLENAQDTDKAIKMLSSEKDIDGYVAYFVGIFWGELLPETVASFGKPTIFVDELFAGSGRFLGSYSSVKTKGYKVIAVSSSRFEDVVEAVRCIETLKKLKSSTILVVGSGANKQIEETFGTKVKRIDFQDVNELYKKVKPSEAKKCAERWISEAEKVIEPSREEIEKSSAMYLTMVELLQQNNAQAITINCLNGIYNGNMVSAYPCLGFMQLDNDGKVGGCEADQSSTITKLLMTYLVGRPGFISDPVIDTSKNQIIYARCVAPTKVFGPNGPSNPYHLRNHSEDRKGASVRSLMPLGEMTTTIRFECSKKQVIFHQGKTVANIDEDKACRTKLAVEVKGDVFKLLNYWSEWGWHRVTFYGDLKRPVYNIATLSGFEVVEEA